MALQASGAISLEDIRGEFNDIRPGGDFLSEYYSVASGIPRKGQEISLSDFYGKVNLQMSVVYSNTDPTLVLEEAVAGRDYEPSELVTITPSTASEFSYTQQGSETRADGTTLTRWYKNYGTGSQTGPFWQITDSDSVIRIKRSSAAIETNVPAYIDTSNAADFGYTAGTDTQTTGGVTYLRYTQTGGLKGPDGNSFPGVIWRNGNNNQMYHQDVSVRDVQSSSTYTVETGTANAYDYWWGYTNSRKYIKTSPDTADSPDPNNYYQWRISGTATYYWAKSGYYDDLVRRTSTTAPVDVTSSNAAQMGYSRVSPTVTENGYTKWKKGPNDFYWEGSDGFLYDRIDIPRSVNDQFDSNNFWKVENTSSDPNNPWQIRARLDGVEKIVFGPFSLKPGWTSRPFDVWPNPDSDAFIVSRGTLRAGGAGWEEKYKQVNISNGNPGEFVWWSWRDGSYLRIANSDDISYTSNIYNVKTSATVNGITGTGIWWEIRDINVIKNKTQLEDLGIATGTRVLDYEGDASSFGGITQITFINNYRLYTYRKGPTNYYTNSNVSPNVFRNSLESRIHVYPEEYGITANWTEYTYSKKRDTLVTYSYDTANPLKDYRILSESVYSYPYQIYLTRVDTSYTYSNIQETRAEVLEIVDTPAFTLDDARERLYRVSTTTDAYAAKTDWPAAPATGYNWRNGRTVQNYYLERVELINGSLIPTTIKTLQATGTPISTGNSTPQRMTFSANAEAASELTDFFYKLSRSESGNNVVNLGYVAPRGSSYPTLTVSGTSINVGNLESGKTYRLKWYGYQETKLAESGGSTAASTGTSSEFTSASIPSFTLSGGDDTRKGMDFYLEVKANPSPVAWAVVRCFEYFQDTNVSDLFGAGQNSQVVACDFLDLFANGRN